MRDAVVAASGTSVQDTNRARELTKLVSCLMTLVLALGCSAEGVDFTLSTLGLDGDKLVKNGRTGLSLPLFAGSVMGGGGESGDVGGEGVSQGEFVGGEPGGVTKESMGLLG
jgi:hypothetical protein